MSKKLTTFSFAPICAINDPISTLHISRGSGDPSTSPYSISKQLWST